MYRNRALSIIDAHDTATAPLFLLLAFVNNHEPLQVPEQYLAQYPDPGPSATQVEKDWRTYQGMITAVDSAVGDMVNKLKARACTMTRSSCGLVIMEVRHTPAAAATFIPFVVAR